MAQPPEKPRFDFSDGIFLAGNALLSLGGYFAWKPLAALLPGGVLIFGYFALLLARPRGKN